MRSSLALLGAAICLTGAGASLALGLMRGTGDGEARRLAARTALVGLPRSSAIPPARSTGGRGSGYWRGLADFEGALSPVGTTPTSRLAGLARAATDLRAAARKQSSPVEEGRTLTLLGLIALAQSSLQLPGSEAGAARARDAVTAFRDAVVADPRNDDAKTDLELLLRSTRRPARQHEAGGSGKAAARKPKPSPLGAPSAGGSPGTPSTPIGY